MKFTTTHSPSSSQSPPSQETPHTVSTIKLPILKKGEYDIWAMKMEHYLAHTDYPISEVIQNGNGPVSINTDTQGQIKYDQTSLYSLLANQSSCPQLDHEDLEQLDEFDLEEIDLKWQVAMISMRMKKFYKKTGRKLQFDAKEPVGFDKTKVECYNCQKTGHFARECRTKGNQDSRRRDAWNSGNKDGRISGKQEDSKALVTIDGEGVDWTSHSEEEEDYALMACNSSSSDTEVTSYSNECKESYAKLKKLYDAQREQLSDASIEIKAYTQGLKKVEAQLVTHQQDQLWPFINTTTLRTKFSYQKVNIVEVNEVSAVGGKRETAVKPSADYPQRALKHKGIVDSGCSRHMTRNKAYLVEFQDFNGGPVAFGGSKGYITGKGKIKIGKLDFEDVCFVKELQHFNLFSVSQICDKKNKVLFTDSEWIKREYSNARTPQQNGVAERKNRTLIEAARTMLADSFLPNTFWAEAVSTACYVLNRVLVTKPYNKTPYELVTGKITIISYIRPFGCHVTILNTIDHLGKFDGKSDEGFLVGYSIQSKAFRVYNLETKRVEENLHITFLENKPNVAGKGPTWLFDLDYLTDLMNYQPVRSENQANKHAGPQEANHNAGTQENIDAGDSKKEDESAQDYFVLPIWSSYTSTVKRSTTKDAGEAPNKHPYLKTDEKPVEKEDQVFLDELKRLKRQEKDANDAAEALRKEFAQETKNLLLQAGAAKASSTNTVNTVSTPVSTANPYDGLSFSDPTNPDQDDSEIPKLEDIYKNPTDGIFTNSSYDDEGVVADFTNLETVVNVNPIPTSRINSIHPST
ncbi:ribonuclease H-like domain-containing protein [Tanacetum coccineum]|uniref:Ribonuclease H-like domain-containing protein n=1 Tax=Tanacetum coccineum TaxID=301880 RepID=A0ABQ4YGY3_9ASTR